ncbi:hypothetical protein [Microbacterium sp. XT11]|uniref:hypothetical protein n=1 Tax=Microbacterium sp. XT11 TaxID=367477 RepID=UPI0008316973|nr:hypothetical protein [Microbacterium sp. XT11]
MGALAILVLVPFGLIAAAGVPFTGHQLTPFDIVMAVIGAASLITGLWILIQLHRSGRQILVVLSRRLRDPYRTGALLRIAAGWVNARTVNFEPPVLTRIITSSLLGVTGLIGLGIIAFPGFAQAPSLCTAIVLWGAACLLTAAGQMGGVMHLVSGVAEQDPLWVRIRDWFRRS